MRRHWAMVVLAALSVWGVLGGCGGTGELGSAEASSPGGLARPVIGITSAYYPDRDQVRLPSAYAVAIGEAGGTPVILPVIEDGALIDEYVRRLDGLVLSGGDDVPPAAYGEAPHATTRTLSPRRHGFEAAMVRAWLGTGKPILGVCRGLQQINVVRGGTLVQDIPTQVGGGVVHRRPPGGGDATHAVTLEPGTRLRALLGRERLEVNSSHHQAAKDVGAGLRVAARSGDGVIEALEFTDGRFGLLVQWHPERMADARHRQAIYGAFVRACRAAPAAVPAGAAAR